MESSNNNKHRVCVYGTLKHGRYNHDLLSSAELLGVTELEGWRMYSLGAYPAITKTYRNDDKVWCEVYGITEETFERLDGLEGYPHLYNRTLVDVDGQECWVYYMDDFDDWLKESKQHIESGKW